MNEYTGRFTAMRLEDISVKGVRTDNGDAAEGFSLPILTIKSDNPSFFASPKNEAKKATAGNFSGRLHSGQIRENKYVKICFLCPDFPFIPTEKFKGAGKTGSLRSPQAQGNRMDDDR